VISPGEFPVIADNDIESRTRASIDYIQHWKGQRVVGLTDQALWDDWRETARHAIGVAATRKGLLGLEGVDYPVATAILDILDPDVASNRSVGRPDSIRNSTGRHSMAYWAVAACCSVRGIRSPSGN
jgi:hypothetical protein